MTAIFVAAITSATSASAEPLHEMIPRLLEESGWLRAHYPGQSTQSDRVTLTPRATVAEPTDLLGTQLGIEVVARDWHQAFNITSGRSLLFDRFRIIRSNRMAVTRVSLGGGRLLPYSEVSFGQWRPDSDLFPWMHNVIETAAQVTVGLEVNFAPRCFFAWNAEQTLVWATASNLPTARISASFAALRAEF